MTQTPEDPRRNPRLRLLLIRTGIVIGAILAIAMGVGLARREPPAQEAPVAASR